MAKIVLDDSDDSIHRWCFKRLESEDGSFIDTGRCDNTQRRSVLRYQHVSFAPTLAAGGKSESRRGTSSDDGDSPSKGESSGKRRGKESTKQTEVMLLIEFTRLHHPGAREAATIVTCPACGKQTKCFLYVPDECKSCNESLPNVIQMRTDKEMRVLYHWSSESNGG